MFKIVLQIILTLWCFCQMMEHEGDLTLLVGGLMVHLALYFGEQLIEGLRLRKCLIAVDLFLLVVMTQAAGSVFVLLVISLIACYQEWKEEIFYVLIVGGGTIGYCLLWDNMPTLELWFWSLLLGGILFWEDHLQCKLKILSKHHTNTSWELCEVNHKCRSLANHQSESTLMIALNTRSELAQKLHDKIGHTLAGNVMALEVVKLMVYENPEKAYDMIERITHQLRGGMDDIRMTLKEVKPQQSEVGIQTIKELLKALEVRCKVKTHLNLEGDMHIISILLWQVITDNLKETVTNFQKYSKADQIEVNIKVYNKRICAWFKDNGLINSPIKKGMGINGMEERTLASRGTFRIQTEEGFEILMIWER